MAAPVRRARIAEDTAGGFTIGLADEAHRDASGYQPGRQRDKSLRLAGVHTALRTGKPVPRPGV